MRDESADVQTAISRAVGLPGFNSSALLAAAPIMALLFSWNATAIDDITRRGNPQKPMGASNRPQYKKGHWRRAYLGGDHCGHWWMPAGPPRSPAAT